MKATKDDIRMQDIPGYEGIYAITSCGKVWSYRRKMFLKQFDNAGGYKRVSLCHKGVSIDVMVHWLVAMAYVPNPDPYTRIYIDHIKHDGDYRPNYASNLEWKTRTENMCNRKCNIPVWDVERNTSYCSVAMAVRESGETRTTVVKSCEQYHNNKGKPPRFIYLNDFTPDIATKYYRESIA